MKKVLNHLLTIITILIFALSLYIMIFSVKAKKENTLINFFGYSTTNVVTNSMHGDKPDSFDQGSLVVTKKVPFEKLKEQDVIVFQSGDILVIHRVIKINEDGSLQTQGDNNDDPDKEFVTKENYQAKMIKHFGFFGLGTKVPVYQTMVLGLVSIALVIYVLIQFFQLVIAIKKRNYEKLKEANQLK